MYFLDTNTCIYFLKGIYASVAERFKALSPLEIKIPAIVQAELLWGVEKSGSKKANQVKYELFSSAFEIVGFDSAAAAQYAVVRSRLEKQGKIIGPNDLLIAAIVLAHKGILVTHNAREFGRVTGLHLEDWVMC